MSVTGLVIVLDQHTVLFVICLNCKVKIQLQPSTEKYKFYILKCKVQCNINSTSLGKLEEDKASAECNLLYLSGLQSPNPTSIDLKYDCRPAWKLTRLKANPKRRRTQKCSYMHTIVKMYKLRFKLGGNLVLLHIFQYPVILVVVLP